MNDFGQGFAAGAVTVGTGVALLSHAIEQLQISGIQNESFQRGALSGYQRAVCENFLAENVEEISAKFSLQVQAGSPNPNVVESVTSIRGDVTECPYDQQDVDAIREFAELLQP